MKDVCALHAAFFSGVLMPGFSINRVQSDINEVVSLFSFTATDLAENVPKHWFFDKEGTTSTITDGSLPFF